MLVFIYIFFTDDTVIYFSFYEYHSCWVMGEIVIERAYWSCSVLYWRTLVFSSNLADPVSTL